MAYEDEKPKDETELLNKLTCYWEAAIGDPSQTEWREKIAIPCINYKEGKQWTAEEEAELKKRAQPTTVNNQVKVTIDRIVGEYVSKKTRISFKGRNLPDTSLGESLTSLFRYIAQRNDLEFEEKDTFEDAVTTGFGVIEATVEFDDDLEPEVLIQHENSLHVFYDPKARRYDWNKDALYVGRWKWVDIEDAKTMFPDKKSELAMAMNQETKGAEISGVDSLENANFIDKERRRIRLVEIQYKTPKTEEIIITKELGVTPVSKLSKKELKAIEDQGLILKRDKRTRQIINVATFTGGIVLENKETERKFYSLIPLFVHRKKNGAPYSLIFSALSLQDAINKRESKALHLLNTNQAIYEKGAVASKDEIATEKARPDGQIELEDGHFEKFRLEKNLDLAQTQMSFHQQSQLDFRRVTGVNPDALGERSEIRSGVGISKKVAQTQLIIAPIFDSLRRTRTILARTVVELIQLYYTREKIFTITDDMNETQSVALSADHFAAIKQRRFDVVVDEIPDLGTSGEEQFAAIREILPQILPFGPFWVKLMLQASTIPKKQDILKAMENIPPPPSDPKINMTVQMDQLTPVERAFFYQKMGAPQELIQAVLQSAPPPSSVLKAQGEQGRLQAKVVGDQAKMQHEREQSQADLAHTSLELEGKKLDISKKQVEVASTITKAQAAKIQAEQKMREKEAAAADG